MADMRYGYALIALCSLLAACGGSNSQPIPNVTDRRLDVAADLLDDRGLDYELIGGGTFGVVVKSHWYVCEQYPSGGSRASSVELVVARSCPAISPPAACPPVVPALEGRSLDDARAGAADAGVEVEVHDVGTGPVLDESNWTVCSQYPAPGERGSTVELYVEHFCND